MQEGTETCYAVSRVLTHNNSFGCEREVGCMLLDDSQNVANADVVIIFLAVLGIKEQVTSKVDVESTMTPNVSHHSLWKGQSDICPQRVLGGR
jgi:hypothetical protein